MVEEKFAKKMEGGGEIKPDSLESIKNKIEKLRFKAVNFRVLVKEDAHENTNDPFLVEAAEFDNIKEAYDAYSQEIKNIRTLNANEVAEYKVVELQAWDQDNYDMEILAEETYNVSYEDDYGKLVIQYQHVGKGMNYAHEFIGLFFLDKYTEKNISTNPDKRFSTWTSILDIEKKDFNGLTEAEAIDLIEREANLKLQNSIDLEDIEKDINLVGVDTEE